MNWILIWIAVALFLEAGYTLARMGGYKPKTDIRLSGLVSFAGLLFAGIYLVREGA